MFKSIKQSQYQQAFPLNQTCVVKSKLTISTRVKSQLCTAAGQLVVVKHYSKAVAKSA